MASSRVNAGDVSVRIRDLLVVFSGIAVVQAATFTDVRMIGVKE